MSPEFENPVHDQDTRLFELVFQRIQKSPSESIPFSDYMEMALYDENHGYYSKPEQRAVGRKGDFYTSVSVGDMFGFLLAQKILKTRAKHFPAATPFYVVEQGAHDGQLALDIMAGLQESGAGDIRYRIVDPRKATRDWLKQRFSNEGLSDRIEVVADLESARCERGIFISNELLDAFPFRRLRFNGKSWQELQVRVEGAKLGWCERPLPDELQGYADELGEGFESGYTTEICPAMEAWMADAATLFERGQWWLIDYGHGSADYFAPHRKNGTYRCYRNHRATEEPFDSPGETDITAHVNFTHLKRAAESSGLHWNPLTDQHHFLIEAAREWLLSIEGQAPNAGSAGAGIAKRLRQFQTLTHPGMMGTQFKVATLTRT